jgi:hypothetical protein
MDRDTWRGDHDCAALSRVAAFAPLWDASVGFRRLGEAEEFSAQKDGLDYTLLGTKSIQIGPVANLRGDRTAGLDARLIGLKLGNGLGLLLSRH